MLSVLENRRASPQGPQCRRVRTFLGRLPDQEYRDNEGVEWNECEHDLIALGGPWNEELASVTGRSGVSRYRDVTARQRRPVRQHCEQDDGRRV